MLWNAPIWLNEILDKYIKLSVEVLTFIFCIAVIGMVLNVINLLIYERKESKKLIDFFKGKYILLILWGLLISGVGSGIGLVLFYTPQQVIPDAYELDSMTIQIITESTWSNRERVTITDKDTIDKFRDIFTGQICRRSFDSTETTLNNEDEAFILIDFIAFDKDRAIPFNFIVKQNYVRRYTSANTDLIYVIEDREHLLAEKIFDYANRYVKKVEIK